MVMAVGWLHTGEIEPTDAAGKFLPVGCAGPGGGNPPTYPPACKLESSRRAVDQPHPQPREGHLRHDPGDHDAVHVGDICNLGIFCVASTSNRNLLDFNMETIDPTTGCAHIAFADDNTVNMLRVANQTTGCLPRP